MKSYTITVNGTAYEVTVEETGSVSAPAAAPKAAPKAAAGAGSVKVEAGAAGKVFKIEANVGQAVKKGDAVVIIEAMKMENEICAPQDGTVATVECAVGDSVETGKVLVSMN